MSPSEKPSAGPSPAPPAPTLSVQQPNTPRAPAPGAVARLVRALRGLPPAERWTGPGSAGHAG